MLTVRFSRVHTDRLGPQDEGRQTPDGQAEQADQRGDSHVRGGRDRQGQDEPETAHLPGAAEGGAAGGR